MKKETFKKFIQISIDKGKREKLIYDNGLDLIDFMDEYYKINDILLCSIYDKSTADIINDFIFDSIYNELEKNKCNYIVYDKDENIIADCSTIDGLYDFSENERLRLNSEGFSYQMNSNLNEEEKMNIIKNIFNQ